MQESNYESKSSISKYNEAIFQLNRLNNSWSKCNNYSKAGKLFDWKWELDVVWRELCPDARKHNEWGKIKKIKDEINRQIGKFQYKNRDKFYYFLSLKEEFLRLLQNLVGKGSKYQDEDEDMM